MTVHEIVNGIIENKNKIGMSNQQLSDASGVPKTTIDRILRHDTPNPTIQTVLDLAAAVGFTFSNHPEQEVSLPTNETVKDPMFSHIITIYENRGQAYEERIKRITSHFNMLLAEKNRWITFSLTLNIILVIFICAILFYDATHPDVGWIREQLSYYTNKVFQDGSMQMWNWFNSF